MYSDASVVTAGGRDRSRGRGRSKGEGQEHGEGQEQEERQEEEERTLCIWTSEIEYHCTWSRVHVRK